MKQFWNYFSLTFSVLLIVSFGYLILSDFNIGINKTVNWAWDFTNFMFWIGLLIYLALLLLIVYVLTKILVKIIRK